MTDLIPYSDVGLHRFDGQCGESGKRSGRLWIRRMRLLWPEERPERPGESTPETHGSPAVSHRGVARTRGSRPRPIGYAITTALSPPAWPPRILSNRGADTAKRKIGMA